MIRQVLANPLAMEALVNALSNPKMREWIAAAARAEIDGTASMIQYLMEEPYVNELLARASEATALAPELGSFFHKFFSMPQQGETASTVVQVEQKPANKPSGVRHRHVICDGCDESDECRSRAIEEGTYDEVTGTIIGVRYKSVVVPNFDLCATCEASGEFEDKAPFLKLRRTSQAPELIFCVPHGQDLSAMGLDDVRSEDLVPLLMDFFRARREAHGEGEEDRAQEEEQEPQQDQQQAEEEEEDHGEPVEPATTEVEAEVPAEIAYPVVPPPRVTSTAMSCPNQHQLSRFVAPHSNFVCNVCEHRQPSHTVLFSCRPCDFDVCNTCMNKRLHDEVVSVVTAPVFASPAAAAATAVYMPPAATPSAPVTAAGVVLPTAVTMTPGPLPQAKFVSDVSVHDGAEIVVGESIVKTWRVRNSSPTVTWPENARLLNVGGSLLGGPAEGVPVPAVRPGEMCDISVPFVMPDVPGKYTSFWRLTTGPPLNARFGHRFWILVTVVARPPPPQPPPRVVLSPQPSNEIGEHQYAEDFDRAVSQIVDFGFSDVDRIVEVLRSVNNDTSRAIDRLLQDG
jgi:hypothetical protein